MNYAADVCVSVKAKCQKRVSVSLKQMRVLFSSSKIQISFNVPWFWVWHNYIPWCMDGHWTGRHVFPQHSPCYAWYSMVITAESNIILIFLLLYLHVCMNLWHWLWCGLQSCSMADDDLDIEAMLEAPYINGVSIVDFTDLLQCYLVNMLLLCQTQGRSLVAWM